MVVRPIPLQNAQLANGPGPPHWTELAKVGANVLVALGTLWLVLSGTCTIVFVGLGLMRIGSPIVMARFPGLEIAIGLASSGIGLGLRYGGRFLRRRLERLEARRDKEVF